MNPEHSLLLAKAQRLDLSGLAAEALEAYRAFLALEPTHAPTLADCAGLLLKLDRLEEAEQACLTALGSDPNQVSARINLGGLYSRRKQLVEAEGQFRCALKVAPHRMDAALCLAECLLGQRRLDEVWDLLKGVLRPEILAGPYGVLKPQLANLWAELSTSFFGTHSHDKAEAACHMALRLCPDNLLAKSNLGSIYLIRGQLEEAEGVFRHLLSEHPDHTQVRLVLINCLTRAGKLRSIPQEITQVLRREPCDLITHKSLMGTYYSLGWWEASQAEIDRFRRIGSCSDYLELEQSYLELLHGDLRQGWQHYEARLGLPEDLRPGKRLFKQPSWKGEPFLEQTLLLWSEQGLGDALMLLRYLPMVKARGGKVLLEIQPSLQEVAVTCPGADILIPGKWNGVGFDLQASIFSLPAIFETDLDSIPADIPYLAVPPSVPHQRLIQDCLAQTQGSTRIGVLWAGNPDHARDHERSLPVAMLAPLGRLPEVAWFSFQHGTQALPPLPGVIPLGPHFGTFADTAYALSEMDLLITVDTSVAHLAGALGIPAFVLLSFQPDFRWMLNRADTPWYPTLRLYRQPAYGDWESVIDQVIRDLTQEAEPPS